MVSDFESILEKKKIKKGNNSIIDYKHKPFMYAIYLHSDKYLKPVLLRYQGKSAKETLESISGRTCSSYPKENLTSLKEYFQPDIAGFMNENYKNRY